MHRRDLERHPGFPDLHIRLADLLLQMGNVEEARKELKEAIRINPDIPEAVRKLAALNIGKTA
ncbi:MAG: tetratricopeptide repeat protein [Candidatus Ozemobacteraceae bacterium]